MAAKKILITGATGFVGRHLIGLLDAGTGASRRASAPQIFGSCFPERPEHCADLCAAAPDVRLIHLDLKDEAAVDAALASIKPDQIYHLAALSQVRVSWEKRLEVFDTNLRGTLNLFEAARTHTPKARILFVSTSDVYGFLKPRRRPCRETDRGTVVSPYAFTKMSGELLSEFYVQREKLPVIVARPFPHTGPGQTPEFVCSNWARQIALIEAGERSGQLRGTAPDLKRPVLRVGNLALRRDYGDVRDFVRAYALLMKKGRPGETYNVCTGKAHSLDWVLKTLLGFSRRKIAVEVDPDRLRKVDIPYLAGDNGKLRRTTGWTPRIPLDRTLRDMLDDWRCRV